MKLDIFPERRTLEWFAKSEFLSESFIMFAGHTRTILIIESKLISDFFVMTYRLIYIRVVKKLNIVLLVYGSCARFFAL